MRCATSTPAGPSSERVPPSPRGGRSSRSSGCRTPASTSDADVFFVFAAAVAGKEVLYAAFESSAYEERFVSVWNALPQTINDDYFASATQQRIEAQAAKYGTKTKSHATRSTRHLLVDMRDCVRHHPDLCYAHVAATIDACLRAQKQTRDNVLVALNESALFRCMIADLHPEYAQLYPVAFQHFLSKIAPAQAAQDDSVKK
jgi:hypothetical protein